MSSSNRTAIVLAVFAFNCGSATLAFAQDDPKVGVTVSEPSGPVPDPSHVPVVLPKDIKCKGPVGCSRHASCSAILTRQDSTG